MLDELVYFIGQSKVMHLKGLPTHAGNNYELKGIEAILANHKKSISILNEVVRRYRPHFKELQLSIGDTVRIIPVHSCLAANLANKYPLNSGEWITNNHHL